MSQHLTEDQRLSVAEFLQDHPDWSRVQVAKKFGFTVPQITYIQKHFAGSLPAMPNQEPGAPNGRRKMVRPSWKGRCQELELEVQILRRENRDLKKDRSADYSVPDFTLESKPREPQRRIVKPNSVSPPMGSDFETFQEFREFQAMKRQFTDGV
jgi:hypothetical protein